jgi:hypothetical protein
MRRQLVLNAVLMALVAVAIVGVEVVQRPSAALEASVRRYANAVSSADLEAAMAEIAPDRRGAWSDWVRSQLGNVYEVRGIAVRTSSLLGKPMDVTVVMDVNRGFEGEFYQPTTTVAAAESDGRWYLGEPLLAN